MGMSCPNRDGTIGKGGCTYCNNLSFVPEYCRPDLTVAEQLEQGKLFFGRKYPQMRYLAYFQAYSNTYAPLEVLKKHYEEALMVDKIVGLVIATRPDCVSEELLDYLGDHNGYGWHISDLVIYDHPRKLSEFYCHKPLVRPPMDWCYVEEL